MLGYGPTSSYSSCCINLLWRESHSSPRERVLVATSAPVGGSPPWAPPAAARAGAGFSCDVGACGWFAPVGAARRGQVRANFLLFPLLHKPALARISFVSAGAGFSCDVGACGWFAPGAGFSCDVGACGWFAPVGAARRGPRGSGF